jgi:hypothetical protein
MPAMPSHLYQNPENPWETIRDTPWGDIPAWQLSALTTGSVTASQAHLKQVRADATVLNDALNGREDVVSAREQAVSEREAFIHDAVAKVHALLSRCDSMIKAEERRSQEPDEPLDDPPGYDDPVADETHTPSGELHDLPAPSETSPVPDDDDEPQMLQRAPAPTQDPHEPTPLSTEFQE